MSKFYTGIGSRDTPQDTIGLMTEIAEKLARAGYILRSGGAQGADTAFANGCAKAGGFMELYLPWSGFADIPQGANGLCLDKPSEAAIDWAGYIWPNYRTDKDWNGLKPSVKSLMGRNAHQVMGQDLQEKSEFVICWTPGGSPTAGGTAMAIQIALDRNVPVYNLAKPDDIELLFKRKIS